MANHRFCSLGPMAFSRGFRPRICARSASGLFEIHLICMHMYSKLLLSKRLLQQCLSQSSHEPEVRKPCIFQDMRPQILRLSRPDVSMGDNPAGSAERGLPFSSLGLGRRSQVERQPQRFEFRGGVSRLKSVLFGNNRKADAKTKAVAL